MNTNHKPQSGFEMIMTNSLEAINNARNLGARVYQPSFEAGIIIALTQGSFWKCRRKGGKVDYNEKVPNDLNRDAHVMLLEYHVKTGDIISQPAAVFVCPDCQAQGQFQEIRMGYRGKCPSHSLRNARFKCPMEYPQGPTRAGVRHLEGDATEETPALRRTSTSTSLSYEEKVEATQQMVAEFNAFGKDARNKEAVKQLWPKMNVSEGLKTDEAQAFIHNELNGVMEMIREKISQGKFHDLVRKSRSSVASEQVPAAGGPETPREND